jgi:hypothetical protein
MNIHISLHNWLNIEFSVLLLIECVLFLAEKLSCIILVDSKNETDYW